MDKNRYIPWLEQLDEKVMLTAAPLPAPDLHTVPAQVHELLTTPQIIYTQTAEVSASQEHVQQGEAEHPAELSETPETPSHGDEPTEHEHDEPVAGAPAHEVGATEHPGTTTEEHSHAEGSSSHEAEHESIECEVEEVDNTYLVTMHHVPAHTKIHVHTTGGDYEADLSEGDASFKMPTFNTEEAWIITESGERIEIDLHEAHHEAVERFVTAWEQFEAWEKAHHQHGHDHDHAHSHSHDHTHEHVHTHEHEHEHEHEEEKEEEEETLSELQTETDHLYAEYLEALHHGNGHHEAAHLRRQIERELHEIEHKEHQANAQVEPQHVRYLHERRERLEHIRDELPAAERQQHPHPPEHRREGPGHRPHREEAPRAPVHPPHAEEAQPAPAAPAGDAAAA